MPLVHFSCSPTLVESVYVFFDHTQSANIWIFRILNQSLVNIFLLSLEFERGYVFFDPELHAHTKCKYGRLPERLPMESNFANNSRWLDWFFSFWYKVILHPGSKLTKSITNPCFCAGTAPGWSFPGSWLGNMTSLRCGPCTCFTQHHIIHFKKVFMIGEVSIDVLCWGSK